MAEERMSLLTAREATKYLNISLATLGRMEKERKLAPFRTPGGHRRYSLAMLNEYLERSRRRSPSANPSTKHTKNTQGDELPHSKVRILVVDDEPDTVELIIRALREDSEVYEFASASNSYEVGVQVAAFRPDLIVLSMARPGNDGFEVCREIKGNSETEHIRIVGIARFLEDRPFDGTQDRPFDGTQDRPFDPSTGSGQHGADGEPVEPQDKKIEEMLRCGADDCLIEPLQIEELQRSVRYLTWKKPGVDHSPHPQAGQDHR